MIETIKHNIMDTIRINVAKNTFREKCVFKIEFSIGRANNYIFFYERKDSRFIPS